MRLNISFMEAVNGVKKDIKVTYDAPCTHCNGSGAKILMMSKRVHAVVDVELFNSSKVHHLGHL